MTKIKQFWNIKPFFQILITLGVIQALLFCCFDLAFFAFGILWIINSKNSFCLGEIINTTFIIWLCCLIGWLTLILLRWPLVNKNIQQLDRFRNQVLGSNFSQLSKRFFQSKWRLASGILELKIIRELKNNLVNELFNFSQSQSIVIESETDNDSEITKKYIQFWERLVQDDFTKFQNLQKQPEWNSQIGKQLNTELKTIQLGNTDFHLVVGLSDEAIQKRMVQLGINDPALKKENILRISYKHVKPEQILDLNYNQDESEMQQLYLGLWKELYRDAPWEFKDLIRSADWKGRIGLNLTTEAKIAYIPRTKIQVIIGYQKIILLKHILKIWSVVEQFREK